MPQRSAVREHPRAGASCALPRVVVLACGNVSRGDDGIGPALLRRLEALALPHVTAVEDYQLQIEHALDLESADLALFIDAGEGTPGPFTFTEIAPARALQHTTHAMSPEAVLQVLSQITERAPPPSFVLCVRGESFELGKSMSREAEANSEAAWELLTRLLGCPEAGSWRGLTP